MGKNGGVAVDKYEGSSWNKENILILGSGNGYEILRIY